MREPDFKKEISPDSENGKWRHRHHVLWILSWIAGSILFLFLGAIGGVTVYLNTQQGQELVAGKIGGWTGHSVEVKGIRGSFPNHLQVERIRLNDPVSGSSPWMEIRQARLDWSIVSLLQKKIWIKNLSAKALILNRLPASSTQAQPETPDSSLSSYQFTLALDRIRIDQIHVAKGVASVEMDLAAEGRLNTTDVMSLFTLNGLYALPDLNAVLKGKELNDATNLLLHVAIRNHRVEQGKLVLNAHSNSRGMIERLLNSDQLMPLALDFTVMGPYDDLQARMNLKAQKSFLKVGGFLDLVHSSMNLKLDGHSPAVTLTPRIHWDGWDLKAVVGGKFAVPTGKGVFDLTNLVAGETMLNRFSVHFSGRDETKAAVTAQKKPESWIRMHVMADGLRIPGSHPEILARDPVILDMLYRPDEKGQPVDFHLQHVLAKAVGRFFIKPSLHGSIDLALPHLESLAALGGITIKGESALNIAFSLPENAGKPIHVDVDGPVMITGGMPMVVNLIGHAGHFGLHTRIVPGDRTEIRLDHAEINGQDIHVRGQGSLVNNQVNGLVSANLDHLSALSSPLKGQGMATLSVSGPVKDLTARFMLASQFQTMVADKGYAIASSRLDLKAVITHFPDWPQAELRLSGDLDHSPVNMVLQAGKKEKSQDYYVHLSKLNWQSLSGTANLDIAGRNFMPVGNVNLKIARLADFSKIIRKNLQGNLDLQMHNPVQDHARVLIDLDSKIGMSDLKIDRLRLTGFIHDPVNKPDVNLKAQVVNIQTPQARGTVGMSAVGGMSGLKLAINGDFPFLMQGKGALNAAVMLDLVKKTIGIQNLNVLVKGERIYLVSPARINFGDKMSVDHLRCSLSPSNSPAAVIDLAGTIKPVLAMNVSIQNITPSIMAPFFSDLKAQGIANVYAKLTGSLDKPSGTIRLDARALRMLTGDAASLPPAQFMSQVNLMGTEAQMNTHVQMGNYVNSTLEGKVPLGSTGHMALNLNGTVDLGLGNAIAGAFGKQVRGNVRLAMQIYGNYAAPVVTGTVQLMNGSFRDFAQGISVRSIQAMIRGDKDHITLQSFTAKAGQGNLHAEGNIGIFQPGIPVSLHFNMQDARPLASDLLTAVLNGDITVSGMAKSRIDAKGIIKIKHAEINIPHSISSSVVPLKVVRPGEKIETEQEKPAFGPLIGLDLTIKSAGQILVQGFGLFTDMAGALHISGTADHPMIDGGMKMLNGHLDLSGISLEFTRGIIGFKGTSVDRKIDPSLDFEVKKSVEGNTVRLLITGFASAPNISLVSSPPLSQDRVLAMLLFGVDSQSLSATQMAEIGLALATLGGQSAGIDPLGTVRKSLGLDRLSLGGGNSSNEHGGSTTGTSVAAGKYVAKGVYIGAKQSTGDAGTQAEMQVDITKHLKATAAVGTGKDSTRFVTPDNDPGSNIGLLYQFDY